MLIKMHTNNTKKGGGVTEGRQHGKKCSSPIIKPNNCLKHHIVFKNEKIIIHF